MSGNDKKVLILGALKIVGVYFILSVLWIFFSDSLVYKFIHDESMRNQVSILKGWVFVIVTSILLFMLIFRILFSLNKLKEEIVKNKKRWEDALINVNDGMWEWNIAENQTFFSVQWKEMIGYSDTEISNDYKEWESRIHPKDIERTLADLNKHLSGQAASYVSEYRLRTKSGSYKWILDRGRITEYLPDGKPLRMLGTHTDITGQKKLEESIRKNEERYRIISENSGNYVWVFNILSGTIDFISPTMQEFLGDIYEDSKARERKEFLMESSVKTIFAQLPDRLIKYEEGDIQQKNRLDEIKKINEEGSAIYLELSTTFIHGDDGLVAEILGVTRDVTDKKEAEKKIAESEEKYRSVFENSNIAILISKPDGTIISANHEAEKLFCMSSEEICKLGRNELVDENDPAFKQYFEYRQKNHRVSSELTLIKKGGERFIGKVSSVSFLDRNGMRLNSVIISDLTEQKQAEEILKKSEEQYRTIFEFSPIAAIFWNTDTKIIFWNRAAEKVFGWKKEEVIGKKFIDFFVAGNSLPYAKEQVGSLVNNIPRDVTMNENVCKDGTIILCEWNNTILLDKFGNPETIISLGRDITLQKRLEAEIQKSQNELKIINEELEVRVNERTKLLEAANNELEAFSYSVSHDLRAPLRAIDGFSRILFDDYHNKIDDNGLRVINIVRSNVKRMGQLIDDLLAFSRLGRKEVNISEIDMKSVFQSIFYEQAAFFKAVNTEFIISDLPKAYADINLIKHVISNLISNALKFTGKNNNPKVEVDGYIENNYTVYTVKDNGAGFNMKYSSKLFGVFQRLHSDEEFEGTGVGLAIVQRIILKHGGTVWAEGAVGAGAKFFFSLPFKKNNY